MDRILSARVDESILDELERVTSRERITKKRFLEEAIRLRGRQSPAAGEPDVWTETLGAWRRDEPAGATLARGRAAFRASLERHHRGPRARVRR